MAERTKTPRGTSLDVWLNDVLVGQILRAAGGQIVFLFDERYAEMPQRPTLSLSFRTASGELLKEMRGYSGRLPPFFANLLPEGELRELLAKWANVDAQDEFALLGALGEDLPGAIKVLPSVRDADPSSRAHAVEAESNANALRFSLAGVQLKLSAVLKADRSLTIPATGVGGSWILKLPAMRMVAVPENEFVMMTLAKSIGIPVPDVELISLDNVSGLPQEMQNSTGNALAARRFDRPVDGQRLHMEDFAQVFGKFPESKYKGHSYANIAAVLAAAAGQEAVADFVRRLMFSALIGNGDMHLKNCSLLYKDTVEPTLSPAYDFVSTIPYIPGDDLALGFGGSKRFARFDKARIARFASTARLPFEAVLSECRETVEKTKEAWKHHEQRDLLPKEIDTSTGAMIETVARDSVGGGYPLKKRAMRQTNTVKREPARTRNTPD